MRSCSRCEKLASRDASDDGFRIRVVMSQHGFDKGEYKYFSYPLPDPIASLRAELYPPLANIANDWNARIGVDTRYPASHADFLARCHEAGQPRPTPPAATTAPATAIACIRTLRRFGLSAADHDPVVSPRARLHRWGIRHHRAAAAHAGTRGGRATPAGRRGDFRRTSPPVKGTRGDYRVNLRHGVSRIRSGHRHSVGIIFHDAR